MIEPSLFTYDRATEQLHHTAHLRRSAWVIAFVLLMASLYPCLVAEARAQAPSDLIAYPRTMTTPDSVKNPKNPRQLTFNRMPGISPDYQVGPGDEMEITIVGGADDPVAVKVSGAGDISVPLVGRVQVAGMTADQIESAIASALRDKGLIKEPDVLVFISSYESKTIYVLGEVDRPGEYSVSFPTTLMDLVFMAGGLDYTAARFGFLHRRMTTGSENWRPTFVSADAAALSKSPETAREGFQVIKVDLQPAIDGKVLEPNLLLQNGDVFYVPRRAIDVVYVIGDVSRPGAFEMPQEGHLTASRAIAWAGGPTKTARMRKGTLVRYENGQRREFPVDFAALLHGDKADVDIRPNDIIFVPGSQTKRVGFSLLDIVPIVLTNAVLF